MSRVILYLLISLLISLGISGCGREESFYAVCPDRNGGGASPAVAGQLCP